ncbi:MAG: hypothetical protein HY228_01585 [Candidatus Yonathbacteria bacterium]|nr:hypothetical protein [Candidatus Yonathbacteria bacterium]
MPFTGNYSFGSDIVYDATQNAVWVTDASFNVTKLNASTNASIATYDTYGDGIVYDSKQNAIWIGDSSLKNIIKLDASTGPDFHNFFQVATAADGGGTITDLASSTMSVLAAGASAVANSPSYTFPTAGTYSVRACADNASSAGGGLVPESDENNNCGAWTNITVATGSLVVTGSIITNDCTITSGSTCGAQVSWTTSNATSTSIQQNGIEFSTSPSGNTSRDISYGLNTFMLFNGSTLLDTKYAVGNASDQGKTGTANGTTRDTGPSTYAELCASGTASTVTTTTNGWSWTCGSGIGIVTGMATKTSTAVCGNNTCESSETLLSCPKDCKGKVQQF